MAVNIGINGFGRIGRLSLRVLKQNYPGELNVKVVNDLADPDVSTFLFKHDTVYGDYEGDVAVTKDGLSVDGDQIKYTAETDPAKIPWKEHGCDIVLECTGVFTDGEKAKAHLEAGAKKVIISAPAKNEDITIVLGVNEGDYDADKHHIVSNASCTTNGLAPVAQVLHKEFGIEKGLLTTIHAYTNSQRTVDTAASDVRSSRAAAENIVPSSTGAAKAVGLVIPDLKGKFTGMAFRVPVPTVSVVDFTAVLSRVASVEEVNAAMKKYADGPMKGILRYTEEELVSSDLRGSTYSAIFSAPDTVSVDEMVKVVAWYDNEWGYSCRIADLAKLMADKGL